MQWGGTGGALYTLLTQKIRSLSYFFPLKSFNSDLELNHLEEANRHSGCYNRARINSAITTRRCFHQSTGSFMVRLSAGSKVIWGKMKKDQHCFFLIEHTSVLYKITPSIIVDTHCLDKTTVKTNKYTNEQFSSHFLVNNPLCRLEMLSFGQHIHYLNFVRLFL